MRQQKPDALACIQQQLWHHFLTSVLLHRAPAIAVGWMDHCNSNQRDCHFRDVLDQCWVKTDVQASESRLNAAQPFACPLHEADGPADMPKMTWSLVIHARLTRLVPSQQCTPACLNFDFKPISMRFCADFRRSCLMLHGKHQRLMNA